MPFVVVSALLAPISYGVAYTLSGQRWSGWLAGLFAIFSGFYFPFWTAIDNFTPFAVTGSLALCLAGLSLTANYRQTTEDTQPPNNQLPITNYQLLISNLPFLSGPLIALAHLARADGPLLLITILLLVLFLHIFNNTQHAIRNTFYVLHFTSYLLLGYLLTILPWLIRNWLVEGNPLPVAGSKTIWLPTAADLFSSYGMLFSYGRDLSPAAFFNQEWSAILQGRWWVLTANLQTVFAAWGMIFLTPLALIGGWHLRRHPLVQLAGLYALLLFVVMTFVFAFPGALGGLFHSGAALLPFIYAAAVVGLDVTLAWVALRRRHWGRPFAKRFFGVGLLLMAIILSGFIYYNRVLKNDIWNRADAAYPALVAWIGQENPEATVMINNPPAYRYHGGGLSVVVPNEDIDTTLRVADRYQVDYLILEPNHPAALSTIYDQTTRHPRVVWIKSLGSIHIFEIIPHNQPVNKPN
jgi:hypothetical protein